MAKYPKRTKKNDFFLPFTTNETSASLQYTEMLNKENLFQFLLLRDWRISIN